MFWLWATVVTLSTAGSFCVTVACVTQLRLRRLEVEEKRQELDFKQSMKLLKDNTP